MKRVLVICWKDSPLVVIEYDGLNTVESILDRYAKRYAFDRHLLTGTITELLVLRKHNDRDTIFLQDGLHRYLSRPK